MPENTNKQETIKVTINDLPLACPMPDTPLWARHPRVYIDVLHGETVCPYCSASYEFVGDKPKGHH